MPTWLFTILEYAIVIPFSLSAYFVLHAIFDAMHSFFCRIVLSAVAAAGGWEDGDALEGTWWTSSVIYLPLALGVRVIGALLPIERNFLVGLSVALGPLILMVVSFSKHQKIGILQRAFFGLLGLSGGIFVIGSVGVLTMLFVSWFASATRISVH